MNEGHSAAWDQEWNKAVTAYRSALQEMPDHPKALPTGDLAGFMVQEFTARRFVGHRVGICT